jgi:hypothetical protein
MSTPEEFGERWTRIRDYARAAGRSPLPDTSMIHFYVNVQDRSQAAFDEARRFYEAYHLGTFPGGQPPLASRDRHADRGYRAAGGFLSTLAARSRSSASPAGTRRARCDRAMATVLPACGTTRPGFRATGLSPRPARRRGLRSADGAPSARRASRRVFTAGHSFSRME